MLGEDCRGDQSYKFECFGIVASTGLYGLTMTHLTRKRKNKINQRRLSPYFGAEDEPSVTVLHRLASLCRSNYLRLEDSARSSPPDLLISP